jgi:hypothetical protein
VTIGSGVTNLISSSGYWFCVWPSAHTLLQLPQTCFDHRRPGKPDLQQHRRSPLQP